MPRGADFFRVVTFLRLYAGVSVVKKYEMAGVWSFFLDLPGCRSWLDLRGLEEAALDDDLS